MRNADEIAAEFPFAYVGGGYFRRKGVPLGEKADILHGDQVVAEVVRHTLCAIGNNASTSPHTTP